MDFEELGQFYLGRRHDIDKGVTTPEPILYDAKDLTTHAMCVGMTGSGKTGLGIGLLEEAMIDGIPVIAIDPKGDMGNLLLTFPKLEPGDFLPWVDPGEAARKGREPEEHARHLAKLWRDGLKSWGQEPERIRRFANAGERAIYTPGSRSGRPVRVLRSLAAPSEAVRADEDALRERVLAAAGSLLGLLGVDADPLRSREHILLSNLLDRAWREGRDLDLPSLIHQIQKPPFERLGVMDVATFFPEKDRFELAMTLNNLLASPGFAAWTEGEALDVGKMLYTESGRPRLSIFSIAHLSDAERMFFVTLLLSELVSWMRSQPGSRSLRALLYMDEVFGYFPPTANPPSKTPMLTLLKQARAYGVGVVLATQNPVDLDYKGLSNCGTWFLGRLQTERDKLRVIDGLEGASAAAGQGFDRSQMDRILSGLRSRLFVMHNVHEDAPVLFESRWVLSYLAGPLTREQIASLSPPPPSDQGASGPEASPAAQSQPAGAPVARVRPQLPAGVEETFRPATFNPGPGETLLYRPGLMASVSTHWSRASASVDEWRTLHWWAALSDGAGLWNDAVELASWPDLDSEPDADAGFADAPAGVLAGKKKKRAFTQLESHVYKNRPLVLWRSKKPKLVSQVGEAEGAFRGRLRDALREKRDLKIEKLRKRFAPKLSRLQEQIAKAEARVEREDEEYSGHKLQTAISMGATLVGALFGRKLGAVGKATTAMRGAGRTMRQRGDIQRAKESAERLRERLAELEDEFAEDIAELETSIELDDIEIGELRIPPRKSDLEVDRLVWVWAPWRVDANGVATPAFDVEQVE